LYYFYGPKIDIGHPLDIILPLFVFHSYAVWAFVYTNLRINILFKGPYEHYELIVVKPCKCKHLQSSIRFSIRVLGPT